MSNLFKKVTASVAAAAVVFSVVAPVVGVSADSTASDAAARLAALGVITAQTSDAGYKLDSTISRREMLKVMMNLSSVEVTDTCEGKFSDLPASDWGCKYAEAALKAGFIAPNAKFRPADAVSEKEALKMIMQAKGIAKKEGVADWAEAYLQAAIEAGVVAEGTTLKAAPAKRSMVFVVADSAVTADVGSDEDDLGLDLGDLLGGDEDDMDSTDETSSGNTSTDGTTPVVVGGDVEVSLNPASASSTTIPRKGLVTFGKFDFTAGDKDVSVDAITLKREGLSERADIKRVYFERNGVRVSTRANVATDDTVLVSFNPALVVKAGSTHTLDLVVELTDSGDGATVGAEHAFSVSKLEGSATLVGSVARTAMMRIGSYVVQTVTMSNQNSSTGTANVGDKDVLLAEFQLQTSGDRNNVFKTISLRNEGTLNLENLSKLAIYNNGKVVSTNVSVSGREVTFTVNSEIENGKNERYEIRADVVSAERSNETVRFQLRNSTDVVVVEKVTNFSAPIGWVASALNFRTVDIKGGNLLLSRDTAVNTNQTVSPSTSDVVLLSANFNVNESVTLEDVVFNYTTTGTGVGNQFNSLRLVVDGRTVSTLTPTTTAVTTADLTFDTTFTVSQNAKVQILGNLKNTAAGTFKVNSLTLGSSSKRYVSNDETATIDGSVSGVNVTISTSTAILVRNDGLTNDILVPGAKDVTLLGFSLRASDVSDIRLSKVNPTVSGNLSGSVGSKITNIRLVQGNNVVSTKNNFDFSGLDILISKNTSASFRIVADFTNSVSTGDTIKLVVDSSSLTARDTASNNNVNFGSASASGLTFEFDSAELKVARNSSQVSRAIVSPSTSEASVFRFELEAKNDNLRVTDLYVVSTGGLKLNEAVKSVSMTVAGRTVQGDVIGEDTIYFSIGNTNPVVVKRDETVVADVRVAFNDDNSRVNTPFTLEVKNPSSGAISGTSNGVRVISEATGEELVLSFSGVTSNDHLYSRSRAVVARQSSVSDINAYEFSVTADANRKLTLSGATFNLGGISGTGNVRIYEKGNSSNSISITTTVAGQLDSTLTASFSGTTFAEISAGSTKTFVLEVTNVDTAANKDRTRTVRLDDISFINDLSNNSNDVVSVKNYNVIPTDSSTWKY